MKTVEIEMEDDGTFSVGSPPPETEEAGEAEGSPQDAGEDTEGSPAEESEEKAYMKPAKTIDEALDMARQLLVGGDEKEQQAQADADMQSGYQAVRGGGEG